MPTDATQETGANVADLETMFDAEPDTGSQNELTTETGAGKPAGEAVVELDEHGQPLVTEAEIDPDLSLELEVDPDAEVTEGEVVITDETPVKLVVDGKEVTKTIGEMKADAQKYEGANKRFEEAAALRKQYEGAAQQYTERATQLENVLGHYIQQSQKMMQEQQPNWPKLLAENPQQYLVERHNWEIRQGEVIRAQQQAQELQRHNAEQQAASAKQRVEQERGKLVSAIPDWADPMKAAEGARAIDLYLHQQGVPPELRTQIDDANVLLIARKAMLYDAAIAKQKAARTAKGSVAVQSDGTTPQRTTRVERPGAGKGVQTATQRTQAQRANAAKAFDSNPSVDTLATYFQ